MMWWIFLMIGWFVIVLTIVPMMTGRRNRNTTTTVFLLTLPIAILFTAEVMLGEDNPFDMIFDFYDDSSVIAEDDYEKYKCSYFETTGSFAYLDAKYGDDSLCDVYEYGSGWKATCKQGTIPKDLSMCEKLDGW